MKNREVKLGEKLFAARATHDAICGADCLVEKIGLKYLYVRMGDEFKNLVQINPESWTSTSLHSAKYRIFLSEQDYLDECELNESLQMSGGSHG